MTSFEPQYRPVVKSYGRLQKPLYQWIILHMYMNISVDMSVCVYLRMTVSVHCMCASVHVCTYCLSLGLKAVEGV